MAVKDHTTRKYEAIRSEYVKWDAKRYKNTRIYTDSYIFVKLSEKYFLSPRTIEHIVFSRGKYRR